ncbi:MAG: translation initiation factor eIF-1A [Candidatus Aenigmarchaeota archaeon]|nr:translation initiation factor eIF-1A [Candidatus Aenigmarchaeota archaeon]
MYKKRGNSDADEQQERVRFPRGKEIIGVVEEMLGGSRFRINCQDGNVRICRVSGKFKRNAWIRPGDVVLIEPWEVQEDERGDVVWKYRFGQINTLRDRGILKI